MDVDGILTDYERLTSFVDQQTGCLVIRSVSADDGGFCPDEYRGFFDPRTVLAYKEHQNPENKYKIPGLVLDWPRRWRTSRNDDPKKYLDSLNTDQAFAHYYLNTKRFIDYSEKNHDWFMRKESLE